MKQYQYRLTVAPEVGEQIERIARATNQTGSKVLRQWFLEASPALSVVADALEHLKGLEGDARAQYAQGIMNSANRISSLEGEFSDALNSFSEPD